MNKNTHYSGASNLYEPNFLSGVYIRTGKNSYTNENSNLTLVVKARKNWNDDKPQLFIGYYQDAKFFYVSSLYPCPGIKFKFTLDFDGTSYAMEGDDKRCFIYRIDQN